MAYSGLTDAYKVFNQGRNVGVQLAHRFLVDFIGLDDLEIFKQKDVRSIFPIYVKNVKFPMFNFKKETFQSGPFDRVFPVLDNNGMELTIEFIEDSEGFVSTFVSSLQKKIFSNGKHNIGSTFGISITTFDGDSNKVTTYKYINCYYLKCEAISLDYEAVDKLTYNITFLCNRYEIDVVPSVNKNNNRNTKAPELISRPVQVTPIDTTTQRYTPSYSPTPSYNVQAPPLLPLRP